MRLDYVGLNVTTGATANAAAPSLVRDPIDGAAFRTETHSGFAMRSLALGVALLFHAVVLLGLSLAIEPDLAGAGGVSLDALGIEVEIVSASALEASKPNAVDATASDSRPEGADGATAAAGAAKPASALAASEDRPKPVIEAKPDPSPENARLEIAIAEVKSSEPEKPVAEQPVQPPAFVGVPNAPVMTGSIAATSNDATAPKPQSAPVTVSPGAIKHYARNVVDVLTKSRPKPVYGVARGTVKVAFAVADNGSAEAIRVTSSSGNQRLDELALSAIRNAVFPPPPPGMAVAHRTYEIPYYFR